MSASMWQCGVGTSRTVGRHGRGAPSASMRRGSLMTSAIELFARPHAKQTSVFCAGKTSLNRSTNTLHRRVTRVMERYCTHIPIVYLTAVMGVVLFVV